MKKLSAKLNSRSGASILMALLLFLICALAGAAALTAAGSNIGRYSYLEEDQQQYLAVSSAAKLIRDQLDDLTLVATFSTSVNPTVDPLGGSGIVFKKDAAGKNLPDFEYGNVPGPTETIKYLRGEDEITDGTINTDFSKFFKDDLVKMVESCFNSFVTSISAGDSTKKSEFWSKAIGTPSYYEGKLNDFTGKYSFELTCSDLYDDADDEQPVKVEIEITPYKESSGAVTPSFTELESEETLNFKVLVYMDNTAYETSGELTVKAEEPKESEKTNPDDIKNKTESIKCELEMDDTGGPGPDGLIPKIKVLVEKTMVTKGTVEVTAKFKIISPISRVPDGSEGGDGV